MITPELINYTKEQLSSGVSRESIKKLLLIRGWTLSDIEMVFAQIEASEGASLYEAKEIAKDTMATQESRTAFLLGTASLVTWVLPPVGALTSIYAMRYAMRALTSIARRQAVAAIILSAIGLSATAFFTLVLLFLMANEQSERITSLFGLITREKPSLTELHSQRFQSYTHPTGDFSLDVPKEWIRDESGASELLISFFNPQPDFHGSQHFFAQLSVTRSEEQTNRTLAAYADKNEMLLMRSISGYTPGSRRIVPIAGNAALLVSGSFPLGDMTIRTIQLFILIEDELSIIAATALADRWDAYRDDFETSMYSFRQ